MPEMVTGKVSSEPQAVGTANEMVVPESLGSVLESLISGRDEMESPKTGKTQKS